MRHDDERLPEILDGRYLPGSVIGRGGMSAVYLAYDLRLGKQWAVKRLPLGEEGSSGREYSGRLIAEAELMKSLQTEGVPRVIDIILEEGYANIVMEYVEGERLDQLLIRTGKVPETTAVEWMRQIAVILDHLHRQSPPIIHRDVKPGNIICRPDGRLVLFDFSIARRYKVENQMDTRPLGTPGYAAPEQYGSSQTDARSDIYSLGVTLIELMSGAEPQSIRPDTGKKTLKKLVPGMSDEFASILAKCISASPSGRFSDCGKLLMALPAGNRAHLKTSRRVRVAVLAAAAAAEMFTGMFITGGSVPAAAHTEAAQTEPGEKDAAETGATKTETAETEVSAAGAAQTESGEKDVAETGATKTETAETEVSAAGAAWTESGETAEEKLDEGRKILFGTSGDASFRERVLTAMPVFDEAASMPDPPRSADSYRLFCSFCRDYLFDDAGLMEPEDTDYEALLSALGLVLSESEEVDSADGTFLRLTMLQVMADLIYEYRQAFAAAGVNVGELRTAVEDMSEMARGINAGRDSLRVMKSEVLEKLNDLERDIETTYVTVGKWKEAEEIDTNKKTKREYDAG